jgi:hypothetical protein
MGVMLEIRWNYDGDDCRVRIAPVIERFGVFFDFLGNPVADGTARRAPRISKSSGRPLGSQARMEERGADRADAEAATKRA